MFRHVSPSPFQTPVLTTKRQTPPSIIFGHYPTSAHPVLSPPDSCPAFLTVFLAERSVQNSRVFLQPKCFPESQRPLPEATNKRNPRNYLNNKETVVRSCGAEFRYFQQGISVIILRVYPKTQFTTTDPDISAQVPNSQTAVVPVLSEISQSPSGTLTSRLEALRNMKNMI